MGDEWWPEFNPQNHVTEGEQTLTDSYIQVICEWKSCPLPLDLNKCEYLIERDEFVHNVDEWNVQMLLPCIAGTEEATLIAALSLLELVLFIQSLMSVFKKFSQLCCWLFRKIMRPKINNCSLFLDFEKSVVELITVNLKFLRSTLNKGICFLFSTVWLQDTLCTVLPVCSPLPSSGWLVPTTCTPGQSWISYSWKGLFFFFLKKKKNILELNSVCKERPCIWHWKNL